jgi:hypothetical protein
VYHLPSISSLSMLIPSKPGIQLLGLYITLPLGLHRDRVQGKNSDVALSCPFPTALACVDHVIGVHELYWSDSDIGAETN